VKASNYERKAAVISQTTFRRLDEYRGFRHVVRNVYTYNFEATKIRKLVTDLPAALEQTRAELLAFASFLEHQSQD